MTHDSGDDTLINFDDTLFGIRDGVTYTHLRLICKYVEDLGYELKTVEKGESLEEVQEKLRTEGARAYLKQMRLQEDISPKAPPRNAMQFVSERLARLGPTGELTIVDPYLFPNSLKSHEIPEYTKLLSGLIASAVASAATVTCVVKEKNGDVIDALNAELVARGLEVSVTIKQTDNFHDRFWIADRSKGVVVGTSLRGLGKRIFFIDALSASDVGSVVQELVGLGV